MDEFSFIEKHLAPLSFGNADALSLKDDAAIISPKAGYDIVITKDALSEGIHFFKGDKPYKLAKKLMRVNISDLAAKGATPYCCFLALILPKNTTEEWLKSFAAGLKDDLQQFKCFLAGGDTVSHEGGVCLTLTAIGLVPSGKGLLRSTAKPGDDIYTTGTIGDSYLGLQVLKGGCTNLSEQAQKTAIYRYHLPQPRVSVGELLHNVASASVDISDGLIADLTNICNCSAVGAEVYIDKIPFSDAVLEATKLQSNFSINAITGGDDYELLFTAPANAEQAINKISLTINVAITKIGKITKKRHVKLKDSSGDEIIIGSTGYKHSV